MADARDRVYALHDFDAENPDEVSFKAGEALIVVEKDDAYGDGWWQGTNPRGETGLFPFSYTTYDKTQASVNAAAVRRGDGDASSTANGHGVKTTMDDIDQTLAGMGVPPAAAAGVAGAGAASSSNAAPAIKKSNASVRSVGSSVAETEEGGDADDDYQQRAKARAALAVNAARGHEEAEEAERAEQQRLKAQAKRIFEEEEERHRQLLLQKESERAQQDPAALAAESEGKHKEAPIPGVDMSDDSDSEDEDREQATYQDVPTSVHAPLLGGLSSGETTAATTSADREITNGSKTAAADPEAVQEHADHGAFDPTPAATDGPGAAANGHSGSMLAAAGAATTGALAAGAAAMGIDRSRTPQATARDQVPQASPKANMTGQNDAQSFNTGALGDKSMTGSTAPTSYASTGPTSVSGFETPKSQPATIQQSPAPSVSASSIRPAAGPGGDPHEWTVEQVVEWGRSKGWDEAQVVSKFAEHEISGDVLMEMDINILKEIDINAFGKRFQVANAIKELKKGSQAPDTSAMSSLVSPPEEVSPPIGGPSHGLAPAFSPQDSSESAHGNPALFGAAAAGAAGIAAGSMAMHHQPHSADSGDISRSPRLSSPPGSRSSMPGDNKGTGPSLRSGWQEYRNSGGDVNGASDSFEDARQSFSSNSRRPSEPMSNEMQYSNFASQHAASGHKKRESASSTPRSPGDRSSFFAGLGGRNRKPAPRVQSGQQQQSEDGTTTPGSGVSRSTFSRLGLNRLKHSSAETSTSQQELRNKISLPTDSPRYDAMGDTARRSRMQGSVTSPPPDSFGSFGSHRREASVGSAGPAGAVPHDFEGSPEALTGNGPAGAVMNRIRPVDREGWMRKRGERYNTWKARYMALKGSDLVLLRDPMAPKIKGYVNMRGYKVIADENTNPGKYGFKILHESEKPHYFSSDDPIVVREWMKALMKATIGRDTSLPVISSYNNKTISLKEAQQLNPPPRPPSPTSRARAQRAAARQNKDQLSAKDANVLMGLQQQGTPQQGLQQSPAQFAGDGRGMRSSPQSVPNGIAANNAANAANAAVLDKVREPFLNNRAQAPGGQVPPSPRSMPQSPRKKQEPAPPPDVSVWQGSIDSLRSSARDNTSSLDDHTAYHEEIESDIRNLVESPPQSENHHYMRPVGQRSVVRPVPPLTLTNQRLPGNLPIIDRHGTDSEMSTPRSSDMPRHSLPQSQSGTSSTNRSPYPSQQNLRPPITAERSGNSMGFAPTPPSKPFNRDASLAEGPAQRGYTHSDDSSTMGLAELPAPPPPSHSPAHLIHPGMMRTEHPYGESSVAQNRRPPEALPPNGGALGLSAPAQGRPHHRLAMSKSHPKLSGAPTPISKDGSGRPPLPGVASSVGSYPTLTPMSAGSESPSVSSAPLAGQSHQSRFTRMVHRQHRGRSETAEKEKSHAMTSADDWDSMSTSNLTAYKKWLMKGHRPGTSNSSTKGSENGEIVLAGTGLSKLASGLAASPFGRGRKNASDSGHNGEGSSFVVNSVKQVTPPADVLLASAGLALPTTQNGLNPVSSPRSAGAMRHEREATMARLNARAPFDQQPTHSNNVMSSRDTGYSQMSRGGAGFDTKAVMSSHPRRHRQQDGNAGGKPLIQLSLNPPERYGRPRSLSAGETDAMNAPPGMRIAQMENLDSPPDSPSSRVPHWKPWKKKGSGRSRRGSNGASSIRSNPLAASSDSSFSTSRNRLRMAQRQYDDSGSTYSQDTDGQEMLASTVHDRAPMGSFDNLALMHTRTASSSHQSLHNSNVSVRSGGQDDTASLRSGRGGGTTRPSTPSAGIPQLGPDAKRREQGPMPGSSNHRGMEYGRPMPSPSNPQQGTDYGRPSRVFRPDHPASNPRLRDHRHPY